MSREASDRLSGRVGLSMNAEQLGWLDEVLRRLYRGGDVSMLLRADIAGSAVGLVARARDRARLVLLQGGAK